MPLGYETTVVNGQMIPIAPGQGYAPLTFGAAYTGPGYWPRNGVYNTPPVMPSPSTMAGADIGMGDGSQIAAGGNPLPTSGTIKQNGSQNFFHPTKSPLVFALLFLVGGLALLHFVHYK